MVRFALLRTPHTRGIARRRRSVPTAPASRVLAVAVGLWAACRTPRTPLFPREPHY